jgi:sporulation protein YlmC with PRC-barrel domain
MAGSKDVKIDIETRDINTFAIGDNTKASVSVGTLPPARQGCQNIRIQHGNITRIAIGNNANASIHLPTQQIDCKEK